MTGTPREERVVHHTDRAVDAALSRYVDAYTGDRSVLVRPVESYEGLHRVEQTIAAGCGAPLLSTDLAGSEHVLPPSSLTIDEPVLAFHTSGSTGSPSAVVFVKAVARAHARAIADALDLDAGTTYVALPPPRFAYGLSVVNSHAEAGVPVTFTDAAWTLPGLTAAAQRTDGDIALYALPQHTPLLLSADIDPDRLVRLFIAGGRISGPSVARLAERFPRLRLTNMYGQAEMGPRLSMWDGPPSAFVEGTIGTPLPGVTLRVDAAHGVGPLVASSPYAAHHILRAPYLEAVPGPGNGEIVTGDLAAQGEDGALTHTGRADHVLNVAGTKVDLHRVQQIVTEVAQPLVVKVHSKPGTVSGDARPVIEIVPGPATPERSGPIRKALAQEFGRLAGLFDITFVRELTLKESGK